MAVSKNPLVKAGLGSGPDGIAGLRRHSAFGQRDRIQAKDDRRCDGWAAGDCDQNATRSKRCKAGTLRLLPLKLTPIGARPYRLQWRITSLA